MGYLLYSNKYYKKQNKDVYIYYHSMREALLANRYVLDTSDCAYEKLSDSDIDEILNQGISFINLVEDGEIYRFTLMMDSIHSGIWFLNNSICYRDNSLHLRDDTRVQFIVSYSDFEESKICCAILHSGSYSVDKEVVLGSYFDAGEFYYFRVDYNLIRVISGCTIVFLGMRIDDDYFPCYVVLDDNFMPIHAYFSGSIIKSLLYCKEFEDNIGVKMRLLYDF